MYNKCMYGVICVKSITLIESTQSKGRVPMNRPRYNDDRCQRHYVPRTGHRTGRRSNQAQRNARSSYWFPVVTMIAAILFAASSIIPRLFFSAFAGEQKEYSISIGSNAGSYDIIMTGDSKAGITLPGEAIGPDENGDGTVTFGIHLADSTSYVVSSSDMISHLAFGDGASAVTSIDANDSGVSSIDISKCTGLESLYLENCPIKELDVSGLKSLSYIKALGTKFETPAEVYKLNFDEDINFCFVTIKPPVYSKQEDGIEFDVKDLDGLKDFEDSDLALRLNSENEYGTVVNKNDNGKYFISNKDLRDAYNANSAKRMYIAIFNQKMPKIGLYIDIYPEDLYAPSVLTSTDDSGSQSVTDSKSVANNQSNTDSKSETGSNSTNTGSQTDTGSKSNTVSQSDAGDDQNTPNVALEINKDSKSIIKNAYIENVEGIDAKSLQIIAKAPSAADKKSFLAAIKNADKNFDDSDANLMVYDIYVADSKGSKVSVKGKAAVTLDLAFPSKTVSFMYDEYNYKVYHQLDDKSIDTSIHAYGTKDGIQLTTDSFSLLAISSTKDESGYTDLTIDDKSKSIIKSAKIHKNTTFSIGTDVLDSSVVKITAVALSSDQKTALINAIKKADSKFKADNNLIAYDVKIVDDDGKTVTVNGKVDFTLAYPSDTVAKNISKYDLTVYHQLSDSSINTNPVAVGVKDGVTVTTDSFSNFAVAFTTKSGESDIPATGESDVMMEIAILLSIISLLSFISIYAKNRSVQY